MVHVGRPTTLVLIDGGRGENGGARRLVESDLLPAQERTHRALLVREFILLRRIMVELMLGRDDRAATPRQRIPRRGEAR